MSLNRKLTFSYEENIKGVHSRVTSYKLSAWETLKYFIAIKILNHFNLLISTDILL